MTIFRGPEVIESPLMAESRAVRKWSNNMAWLTVVMAIGFAAGLLVALNIVVWR